MKDKTMIRLCTMLVGVPCISMIAISAHMNGINGNVFTACMALIAGILGLPIGYSIAIREENGNDKEKG